MTDRQKKRQTETHGEDGFGVGQGLFGEVTFSFDFQLQCLRHVRHHDVDQTTDSEDHVLPNTQHCLCIQVPLGSAARAAAAA